MKKDRGFIQVLGTDKRMAAQIELALEQRLLDETMQELGAFLSEETKPAKSRKAKKEGKR